MKRLLATTALSFALALSAVTAHDSYNAAVKDI
jgi:hypothetical protein